MSTAGYPTSPLGLRDAQVTALLGDTSTSDGEAAEAAKPKERIVVENARPKAIIHIAELMQAGYVG